MIYHREEKNGEFVKTPEELIAKRLEAKSSKFEYIYGYDGCESSITIMCKDCGKVLIRNVQIVKPCRIDKIIECNSCKKIASKYRTEERIKEERKLRHIETEKKKAIAKAEKYNENHKPAVCPECGKNFITKIKRQKYCCGKCANRVHDRTHEHMRRSREQGGIHDGDISLNTLIVRDKNICHICGKPCDINDFKISNDVFIAGDYYPSIDHVIPLSKNGKHVWSNVKLAHRICNSIKSDK